MGQSQEVTVQMVIDHYLMPALQAQLNKAVALYVEAYDNMERGMKDGIKKDNRGADSGGLVETGIGAGSVSQEEGRGREAGIRKESMAAKGLTVKETQILPYLYSDWTVKYIASELQTSHNTMRTHVRNICHKLKVANRLELMSARIKTLEQERKET